MAEVNPVDGEAVKERDVAASNGDSTVEDSENNAQDTSKSKEDGTKTVPYYKLFSFADSLDYMLMSVGVISAIGNGLCQPLVTVIIGDMINSFGGTGNTKDVVGAVSKVALKYVYLAVGAGAAAFLQMSCWMITGERQAARIRGLYLKTILRQDVGFFDNETNTGEIIGRMSGDTVLIQEAMGEKVGSFIQLITTFIGSFIIAFVKGWLLTLVMLSSIPLLVFSGAMMGIVISKLASRGQTAYSLASTVVDQTVGSIRTVVSFTGEKHAIANYNSSLIKAYKSGVHEGLASGFGIGSMRLIVMCSYGLAIWFGGKMIVEKGYTGGEVMNVVFAVLNGSLSLGQASPCMSAFAAGKAAAYKMFETINRKPEIDTYDTNGEQLQEIHGEIELRDVYFRPHSELIKDSEGAYSRLIRLQEMRAVSEKTNVNDHDRPEISSVDSRRHASPRFSNLRSISWGSSGRRNSGRHSLSISFGVPTAVGVLEAAPPGSNIPDSKSSRVPPEVSLRRLAYLNKPEIPVLLLGTIAAAVNGVFSPFLGVLLACITKTFFEPPQEVRKDSKFWALIFIVLGLASSIAHPLRQYLFAVAGCRLIKRVRSMCFEKVVYMEVSWFDDPEHSSGAIGARLSADAASLRGLVGDGLGLLVQNLATAVAGLLTAFLANWQLALIVLVLLPLLGVNGYFQVKFMKGFSADAKKMYEEASQVANDAVGNIRTIASFCAEEKVIELYQKKCEGPIKKGIRQGLINGIGFGLSFFFMYSVHATSFYAGARLVSAGKTTFSDVFRVFFALTMATIGVSQSGSLAPDVSKAKSSAASIFAILDRKSKIDSSDESGTTIENVKGDIELRHVNFKYPTRPDVLIFQDLCLTIRHGKTVALVGESGSGKSTVISLLQRFYDPDSGHITLDGIEIQKLQLKWLRQQMGLVSQEPVLFNETIRANIAYGKEGDATEAEIIAAAELANAHRFISSLQQGYDTIVGERGVQLSGGQKQRVAIARAIMKAPKILLLDEATSALDAESERVVQDALDRVMVDRTAVVVAHRLSTIRSADLIAVVKNGVIAEKGKHETLINVKDGIYASLVTATLKGHSTVQDSKNSKQDSSENKEDGTKTVPYYKLFSFADTLDYMLMSVGTISAIGNGLCTPLMTVIFGEVINSFGRTGNTKEVVDAVSKPREGEEWRPPLPSPENTAPAQVALKNVYLAIGAGVAAFLQVSCWMVTGERQAARIRSLYLKTILRQDVGFFDTETNTGEIVKRMSGDTVLIQEAMGEKVGTVIQLIATFIGGFVIAFVKGWLLALVMLSSIPPLVLAGAVVAILVSKLATRGQAAYSVAATVVEQTIVSIRTVASFTGEKQAISNYNNSLIDAYNSAVLEGLASGCGIGSVMLIMMCSYALAIWFGGKMILERGYTGGEVISVLFAVLTGSLSLGNASPCMSAFAAGQAAAYKMFETINRKPDIDAYDTNGQQLQDIRGEIELRDVYFSYPARPDEQLFHGFSLSIPSGETAALVGESGSGKSTVISLIERFYDPQAGEVLIDGINLKEFQLKWIRQKIGLVSQEPVWFPCSIKDNIAYGKDGATNEEIRAAAELANAAEFIDNLPQGLDTMVGEHGTQLSGDQKQRVAIARAILKDPRILLLDEATSALEAESERVVQEALDRIMINRTTVIVAHRLSTVRNVDSIAVLHRGTIVEKGPHSELVKHPEGAYSQLIRLQEMNNTSDKTAVNDQERRSSVGSQNQSQIISHRRSISRGSSGGGNNRRHSFSISYDVPAALGVLEVAPAESDIPDSESSRVPPEVSLCRLAYLNKPEIPVLLLATIAAIANGVVLPIFGLVVGNVIKTLFEPPHLLRNNSKFWALIFFVLGVGSCITFPSRQYLFAVAGNRLIKRVRSMCFEKVVYMEVSWFEDPEHSSGAIGATLSADVAYLRGLVGDALGFLVQNLATAIAGLHIAFVANWQLALKIIVLLPLLGVNGYFQFKFTKGSSANARRMYEEASQVANDAVGSIRTIASFCAEEKVVELYQRKCEGLIKTGIRQGLISGIGFGLSLFLQFSVFACIFYAGSRLVAEGKTTFADVFRVFFALTIATVGISQSDSLAPDISKGKSAVASIFAILDRKSKIDSGDNSGTTIENLKGEIELCHVSFKYPTRPDVPIFKDLCLTIHHGKTVALVGESGSGKSTVVSLLQRFYDPDLGHITLDGIEIQRLQLKWLRQQMGLVSQEPVLLNDTIRANIAYGKEGTATEAEIIAAAELANAHKFICSLQQGYDTIVGERGDQLSGGQKQRVAIARAIMKAPKILLLDEATSGLDAESERVVQDALDRVKVDRTTVVVAHRLSTIKSADLIAVLKNGVIAEKGKHEALINIQDGIYASLVALRASASS
ncbi:hypothetical protein DVH24_023283 [Malus domestica]|uniref:Uncharacterized protein n=1 Tax=Malus domestica TaxID=3750 RepID=A0A498KQE3_MALDO|nr:hypothetical protein DVH24_023283 [Malus domestica]